MLDGYNVEIEIEELGQHHVVLVIRALRLIVLGRTLGDAQQLARAAIASRSQDDGAAGLNLPPLATSMTRSQRAPRHPTRPGPHDGDTENSTVGCRRAGLAEAVWLRRRRSALNGCRATSSARARRFPAVTLPPEHAGRHPAWRRTSVVATHESADSMRSARRRPPENREARLVRESIATTSPIPSAPDHRQPAIPYWQWPVRLAANGLHSAARPVSNSAHGWQSSNLQDARGM